jgi:hypothetical protein
MFRPSQYSSAVPNVAQLPTSTAAQYQFSSVSSRSGPDHGRYTPDSVESMVEEKPSLDFTQRIERKLAEYNASDNVFKRWLLEITCWTISASCMVAIVFIYVRIKDRSMSENALLIDLTNVLGKVSSAALIVPTSEALGQLKWNWFHNSKAMWDFEIFDKASRGPWGALMLLFRTWCALDCNAACDRHFLSTGCYFT